MIGAGANIGAAAQLFYIGTPVQLLKAPTVTVAAGTFKTNQAGTATATTITPGAAHTPTAISIIGNSAGTPGQATLLQGGGGSGWIVVSADADRGTAVHPRSLIPATPTRFEGLIS